MSKSKNRKRTRKQQTSKRQHKINTWVDEIATNLMGYLSEHDLPLVDLDAAYDGFACALRDYLRNAQADGMTLKEAKATIEANFEGIAQHVLSRAPSIVDPFMDEDGILVEDPDWRETRTTLEAVVETLSSHNLAAELCEEIDATLVDMAFVSQIAARNPEQSYFVVPLNAVWYLRDLAVRTKNEVLTLDNVDPDHELVIDLYEAYLNLGYAIEDLDLYEPLTFPCGCPRSEH